MKKNNIFTGVLILSVGSVLAKIFSAIYRIVLTRILGGEGIGVYQLIFPFYSLCVTLASAGIPMAVSKVIAKNKGCEKSILKKILKMIFIASIVIALFLAISAKMLAKLQGVKSIYICYLILAPSIMVVGVASVLRGYFQGVHNFVPSAISNIIEQFIKLVFGVILTVSLMPLGIIYSVIGAVVAIVISEIISLLCLIVSIKKEREKTTETNLSLKMILKDILPITITNLILPLSNFIDSILVINLLSISLPKNISVFLYGIETGAVASLVGLPSIFSFAVASVALPNIAKENIPYNRAVKLSVALKTVVIISLPFAIVFLLTPHNIIDMLYAGKLNGFNLNGASIASGLLAWSGLSVVFLSVNQVLSSTLQALDERSETIRNLLIGVVVKLILVLMFMPCKYLNIYVLSIANLFCYLTVATLNYIRLNQKGLIRIDFKFSVGLIVSNLIMLLILISLLMVCKTLFGIVGAYFISAVVYLFCVFKTGTVAKRDLATFKYGV